MLPSVDPSLRKNIPLESKLARAALAAAARAGSATAVAGDIERLPAAGQVAAQVSRWDPLKGMDRAVAVLGATAARVRGFQGLVVGPAAESASEIEVLASCIAAHRRLPADVRRRIHVLQIPRSGSVQHDDLVRAAQCAGGVVLQMSRQEGFGLSVTEALVKRRPVVAADVGGIRRQLGRPDPPGVLVRSENTEEWVAAIERLLDPTIHEHASRLARTVALQEFTVDRHLQRFAEITGDLVS
jgi:trehalose synthase